MLVLSRRPNEEIVFPNTGIRVRFLKVKGNVIRVGIDAPPAIQVLRAELEPGGKAGEHLPAHDKVDLHALRNKLSKVTLGLHLYQQQCQAGLAAKAQDTFDGILAALEALDRDWPSLTQTPVKRPKKDRDHRCRALIVEDDANERELLAGILSMNGCECETAADGQDALDYLAAHQPPDFVLLDMGLPRLSGPQALEQIRKQPHCGGLKVFAISGSNPKDLGIAVGGGGVDAWFHKPLNPRRLWEAICQGVNGGETN